MSVLPLAGIGLTQPGADFMNLLETHPKIASKIALSLARHLGGRLRQANAGQRQDGHL